MDIIRIAEGTDSLVVSLDGGEVVEDRDDFWHRVRMEISSDFVGGNLSFMVARSDILGWGEFLERLEREPGLLDASEGGPPLVVWPYQDRTPYFQVYPEDPLRVEVVGSPMSWVRVSLSLDIDVDEFVRSGKELVEEAIRKLERDGF
ncbi:DUF5959 family protein [Nocardiopsis sp. CC223A]|uniref:DUF5959 family protein n=1 Tax=Nocardiopsis sp. CC223A TaxID=3044051 RepID=UPI0027956EA1|nr:DUF5959 family protein [Nocardiopsis sp. CC223A]